MRLLKHTHTLKFKHKYTLYTLANRDGVVTMFLCVYFSLAFSNSTKKISYRNGVLETP